MGFGGSGSMRAILKNNRNLLKNPKRKKFKSRIGAYDKKSKTVFDLPKANAQVLKTIREKVKTEQKKRTYKIVLLFGVVFISFLTCVLYWLL